MPKKSGPPAHPDSSLADGLSVPAARVLRRFRVVFNAVKAHFRQVESSAGIAGAQVWALSVISDYPGIGVGGVAHAMDIHQSTASNLLKPLIDRGMVAADREGEDRRAVHLHISTKGAAVLRDAPGPFAGVLPDALGSMDSATLSRLDRDLAKLCQLLGVDARGAAVPLGQPNGWRAKAPGEAAASKKTAAGSASKRTAVSAPRQQAAKTSRRRPRT
jgi:DNA-binding MarR family transcriptional regulator